MHSFFSAHSFLSFYSGTKLFYHRKLMLLVTTVKHFFNLLVAHGNRGSQRINRVFKMPGGGNYVLPWKTLSSPQKAMKTVCNLFLWTISLFCYRCASEVVPCMSALLTNGTAGSSLGACILNLIQQIWLEYQCDAYEESIWRYGYKEHSPII